MRTESISRSICLNHSSYAERENKNKYTPLGLRTFIIPLDTVMSVIIRTVSQYQNFTKKKFAQNCLKCPKKWKNATWRWQWDLPVHSTSNLPTYLATFAISSHTFRYMNYYPVTDRRTDRRTDRQKAMHMSPPCNMHRWAQKCNKKILCTDVISHPFLVQKGQMQQSFNEI